MPMAVVMQPGLFIRPLPLKPDRAEAFRRFRLHREHAVYPSPRAALADGVVVGRGRSLAQAAPSRQLQRQYQPASRVRQLFVYAQMVGDDIVELA